MHKIERLSGVLSEAFLCDTVEEEVSISRRGWGHDRWELTRAEIEAILNGKILVLNDGEYTHAIMKEDTP